jgi:hypothetical protein
MATHIEPPLTVADLDLMPHDGNRYEVKLSGVIPDLVFVSHERRDEIASGDRITEYRCKVSTIFTI